MARSAAREMYFERSTSGGAVVEWVVIWAGGCRVLATVDGLGGEEGVDSLLLSSAIRGKPANASGAEILERRLSTVL